ncbi:uncharacterized protein CTRU02_204352 [Colletotrichum truncatum]|uniref:Uncharacterized protein n=1 Tax=Colletotrichum truncatum TaxID=5467 RepID=A0ACC3ZC05_COLTU|nr:uncharacterized protein CTRU02_13073 [Colletotrichum truncatum]KAF6783823.1 hypothetical protein CTRU02_13073 [Colletotrichum truncatum]
MSSSDSNNNGGKSNLTDREVEILKHAWNCLKTLPEIDSHKLAAALGMSNHRSAQNAWGAIKKKLFVDLPTSVDENGEPVATPNKRKRATPAKKKTAVAEDDDEADDLNAETEEKLVVETPVKKKRATPKKKTTAAASAATEGEADGEESAALETPVKKKRATPAKRRTPAKAKKEQDEVAEEAAEEDEPAEAAAPPTPEEAKDLFEEDINMVDSHEKVEA